MGSIDQLALTMTSVAISVAGVLPAWYAASHSVRMSCVPWSYFAQQKSGGVFD
jgi:hypothetical protein